jgi:hypothetical protein
VVPRPFPTLEFHHVPKHASWLNMVEIEIGVLCSQRLDRRIATQERRKKPLCRGASRMARPCKISPPYAIAREEKRAGIHHTQSEINHLI